MTLPSSKNSSSRQETDSDTPFLYMAPLRGLTDALFRRLYCQYFGGIDSIVAPFINPQKKAGLSEKLLRDVLPELQCDVPLIPQLLNNNADDFVATANRLFELGYSEINWNLGCPVPMVAKKRRGSGLLPYPDQITSILDEAIPRIKPKLSIKMRLGYADFTESITLLPKLDDYPLTEIIIHARLGKQLYRGPTSPEHFLNCSRTTAHKLVYNGDIISAAVFSDLREKLPTITRWMIGRPLITNPFLPAEIKGQRFTTDQRLAILHEFHDELYAEMKELLSGPGHLLGRMKQIWIYLIGSFPGQEKKLKKITKASTEEKYLKAVQSLFAT